MLVTAYLLQELVTALEQGAFSESLLHLLLCCSALLPSRIRPLTIVTPLPIRVVSHCRTCRMSKGIREAPTKAVMNELAHDSGDSPDAAYGEEWSQ